MQKEARLIGVVGYPRVGSNLLIDLLMFNQNVASVYEIFNHKTPMMEINELINSLYGDYKSFHEFSQIDPVSALNSVITRSDHELIVYKIFPGHLSDSAFIKIANESSLLIFIKRNLLAAWASDRIAENIGIYYGEITNSYLVNWEVSKFIDWSVHVLEHMDKKLNIARDGGVALLEVEYSNLANYISEPNKLWEFLIAGSTAPFQINIRDSNKLNSIRQDTRSAICRFGDQDQVAQDLKRLKIDFLLDQSDSFDIHENLKIFKAIQYQNGYYARANA